MFPGGGLLIDAKVAIDDCEFDLVGLPGLTWKVVDEGAGDGAAGGTNAGEAFANPGDASVGVLSGVLAFGAGVVSVVETMGSGWLCVGCRPAYTDPSSPGANVKVEQKPSLEDIIRVNPSFDQARSVNVA